MNDIIKTIKAQLYDRVFNPLSSTLTISWCLWNWKFILVVFSNMQVNEKFDYINSVIYPNFETILKFNIGYPLLTTLFVIFIYPYPARFVYEYWRRQQQIIKGIRQRIEDEEPLTKEEARELRKTALQIETRYEKEILEERQKNEAFQMKLEKYENNELSKKEKQINENDAESRSSYIKTMVDLNNAQVKKEIFAILKGIENNDRIKLQDLINGLKDTLKLDSAKIRHYIDLLQEHKYIEKHLNDTLSNNQSGRSMLVNSNLTDFIERVDKLSRIA